MSLFPSAKLDSTKQRKNVSGNKTWLENKSFDVDAAKALHKEHKNADLKRSFDISSLEESSREDFPFLKKRRAEEAVHSNEPVRSDSSSEESDGSCGISDQTSEKSEHKSKISLDKSADKNNLYFKRPYKVDIPRFHRSVQTCVGLSPHLMIIFEKDPKKRKKAVRDRYYHISSAQLDVQEEDTADSMKHQVETLNIETRENQTNIDAWLQLVSLQDKLSGKNFKLKTEKQISILDKAVSANPRNFQLKMKRLELLESISEDSDREWKNLVFHHPDNKEAWKAYISYTLKHARFTVSKTLKVFEKCFETLSSIRKQTHHSSDFIRSIEKDMMQIFTKLVQFLVESGHTELTITLLLVMLEINVRANSNVALENVELFYQSGDPILGEANSKGWNEWHKKHLRGGWAISAATGKSTDDEDNDDDVDFDKSINENWLDVESKRGKSNLLPWRSDEDCEDPGRKVSYNDIKGFLFLASEMEHRVQLFKIFLQVVGSKLEDESENSTFSFSQPCQFTHAYYSNEAMGNVSPLLPPVCSSSCKAILLPRKPHHQFICLVAEQLTTSCSGAVRKHIAALSLGYFVVRLSILRENQELTAEGKRTYKEARKFAKGLLKRDPANFTLWAKLAKVEFLAGNFNECKKITFNALRMCESQDDAMLLSLCFAELAFGVDDDAVRRVLCALGDGLCFSTLLEENKEVSGAVLLRAGRSLERICEELGCLYQQVQLNIDGGLSSLGNAACCHIFFLAVSSSPSLHSTINKYLELTRKEKNNCSNQATRDLLRLHNLKVKLIDPDYKHCNAYRNALLCALTDVPFHPQFALKLCQVEVGSSLCSVARRLFSSVSAQTPSFFSIYFELLRLQRSGDHNHCGVTPRILHILERYVSTHADNILMWRIYAALSKNSGSILTRATSSCPWSKAIACDRIRLGMENIDDIVIFMQDKGLRVRTPVEEIRLLLAV